MTAAQQSALHRAAEADGPVKILASTAAVLAEQYRFIEAAPGGWVLTASGRAHLARQEHERIYRECCQEIPKESKAWAKRVMAWLACHDFIGGMERWGEYRAAQEYAEHYAACVHASLVPVRPAGDLEWIEHHVRNATECLQDFDKAQAKAKARDCGVGVTYSVDLSHPKAKTDAAASPAVARPDGTVDLRAYRLARPEKPGGVA